jgi:hypothetical protein
MSGRGGGSRSVTCDGVTGQLQWSVTYSMTFSGTIDRMTGRISATGQLQGSESGSYRNCRRGGQDIPCPSPTTYSGGYSHPISVLGTVNAMNGSGQGTITVSQIPLTTTGQWQVAR